MSDTFERRDEFDHGVRVVGLGLDTDEFDAKLGFASISEVVKRTWSLN